MPTKRKKSDKQHPRKFLVVIDGTPECERAVLYASKRARNTGGKLVMLYVIQPGDFQHWLGVEDIMRAEATDEGQKVLAEFSEKAVACAGIEPETIIREGQRADEILGAIEDDPMISILVLAAGTDNEGPGPLVTTLAGRASGTFPVPITVVPGNLADEDIEAVT
ncbi:MAG: universal stress protein [Flavobacteriaceae bacterium]